ncbi:MAG: hypothetical protein IKO36_06075 [Bacteroidaceae bacterium]|nr:hypothetical protein [Bacteroidaceae bacterium]
MRDYPECIISLNDSQILRFIDEFNNALDSDDKAKEIKRKMKQVKKRKRSPETKALIRNLYQTLYDIQYQKDYLCVVMDSNKDYDLLNSKGFTVNGVEYKRLLGTNGGIKNSTIIYVSERLYPMIKERIDNGRDKTQKLVPAKLEAYQALVCSGSVALPEPKGIIVVNDCITHFKDNVILIDDTNDGKPTLTNIKDYDVEHNDSDGYGLMSPEYSITINEYLNGISDTLSGFTVRYAWTKGMLYTFDFVDFAENVSGTYIIKDAWGDERDIRDADVILTTSMLKLWDAYKNWEDFYENCHKNHYEFSAAKTTPIELENIHNTNYQFLQSYDFDDDELYELCKPTIDSIKDIFGMDYRKAIIFLCGMGLNSHNVFSGFGTENFDCVSRALMIEPQMINDPFIRKRIMTMIGKRINDAKKGVLSIDANYAMISGDPYALCQSMFGMNITGLLKSGEVYHKYWIDKGSKELSCFRAPMTCHNNIRKLRLNNSEEYLYWYQYIKTAVILNAWDTTCDAMNGADKDGDTNMDTDNPIILRRTKNSPTIICTQRKADKVIPDEDAIIESNKLAFNDDIGTVTNRVTTMIEIQSRNDLNKEQYNELSDRIMCGQLYQQNTIDRAKGIIAKPMPEEWYSRRSNVIRDEDSDETIQKKNFDMSIVADRKPYFMIYVYPHLKKEYDTYTKNADFKSTVMFGMHLEELASKQSLTKDEKEFIDYYKALMPVGINPCVVNRISWIFQNEFNGYLKRINSASSFDYNILKSDTEYSQKNYNEIKRLFKEYLAKVDEFRKKSSVERIDDAQSERRNLVEIFKKECELICTNEDELCNIVLDICYKSESSKQFAWDICGNIFIKNLLKRNNYSLSYPEINNDGEFNYMGYWFTMVNVIIDKEEIE